MNQFKNDIPAFAFLVQPRSVSDIRERFPFLFFIPDIFIERGFEYVGPIIVAYINGFFRKDGKSMANGIIISVPMTARRMLVNRKKARLSVQKTIVYAQKKGAKYIGLGSLTSPIVNGGTDVFGRNDIFFTNGNALTAVMTVQGIEKAADFRKRSLPDCVVVVVGATGSIGSAVSNSLVKDKHVKNIILVGRTLENLNRLKKDIVSHNEGTVDVTSTTDMTAVALADIVIVATSGSGTLIRPEHLKKNAIVYDITQPQNVDPSVRNTRTDVMVIDGGLVSLPEHTLRSALFGLPQGIVFSCLAETMIIAALDEGRDFSIGHVTRDNMNRIEQEANRFNVSLAPLTMWNEYIQQ